MKNHHNQSKNNKTQNPESKFRSEFSNCSKTKDFKAAVSLFESAISQNIKLNLHHLNCFLYICSNSVETAGDPAIEKGFNIFNYMISNNVNPNEATITAVSRLAAAKNDADLCLELAKSLFVKYKERPRLRTFDSALFCYVKNLNAGKAYLVEEEILSNGLSLEEAEISGLLKVSVEVGNGVKVYEYLHKLRESVRCVSELTAEVIESWFKGDHAGKVGGLGDVDEGRVKDMILKNGGGWHGLGWVGNGDWVVQWTNVDLGGCCCACKTQLACVDIGGDDTEKFAQSVVALAIEREKRSNFTQFQNWLDEHNNFEAILDGANIGLYQQNFAEGGFSVSQLEIVVNELYKRSNKWPLVILHDKRIRSLLADPSNRRILEEWIDRGILYGTPVGSNDDWYWLYASVKLKCMLMTNDEMRDHIFELLGRSFFPIWKERHHVHYAFPKGKLKLQMPPSYSLVIQETERGTWHVPIAGEYNDESHRTWLCITHIGRGKAFDEISKSVINVNTMNGSSHSSHNSGITGKRKERSTSPTK